MHPDWFCSRLVCNYRHPYEESLHFVLSFCLSICPSLLLNVSPLETKYQRGAILERWDRIDGYLVEKLLRDPRFPKIPSSFYYTSTFSEPNNWGHNYGSRISGYFVPQQTGPHVLSIGITHYVTAFKTISK